MTALTLLPLTALLAFGPVGGAPQEGSWVAWHGCWKNVSDGAPADELLCILPGPDATEVRVLTVVNGAVTKEAPLRADGEMRRVEEGGCVGSESARWSKGARRLYLRAEFDCEGKRRTSTGIIAMIAENEWVSAEAVQIGEETGVRTIRYRAAAPMNLPTQVAAALDDGRAMVRSTARLALARALDIDDVIEASAAVSRTAVEALLAVRNEGFGLNPDRLVALQKGGVPGSTIDVMVALTYPKKFQVRGAQPMYQGMGQAAAPRDCYGTILRPYMSYEECMRMGLDQWGFPSVLGLTRLERNLLRSRYYRGYGYNPYGYGYSSWDYDPYLYGWNFGRNPIVVVRPEEVRNTGQLVKGSGYTTNSTTPRTAAPRSGSGTERTSGTSTTSTGSSTSSGSSTSGSSTPPRTAIPRGGGGGGQ